MSTTNLINTAKALIAHNPAIGQNAIDNFNAIIDNVEWRCLTNDGPVTPTLQEITEKELSALWQSVQCIRGLSNPDELKRLQATIERERSQVAESLEILDKAISRREWLREPYRGSFPWDDEGYQAEFGAALDELKQALTPLRKIASDWSDCPTDPDEIKEARTP